jgi:hypothetical protein
VSGASDPATAAADIQSSLLSNGIDGQQVISTTVSS